MRILSLSWRYVGHPAAGGAETVTHEVLRRFAAQGHDVTAFGGTWPGARAEDELDGVRIVRDGTQASVHIKAWRNFRKRIGSYDRVIDQVNTIPFLTPLWVPADRRVFFIHQLAREYWWRETRGAMRAVAPVGYGLEPLYLRIYRRTTGLTVSDSTRRDLARLGVRDVHVVPQALHTQALDELPPKPSGPLRLLIAGRLTPAKFVEEGIRAFGEIRASGTLATLDVVGGGDDAYRRRLQARVRERALEGVRFHGRVPEDEKHRLMRLAHVQLFTSHREGWGLVVSEAAAMGTPSVGYDVPGVRDSIGDASLLAPRGDYRALAALAQSLWADEDRYERVRRSAWKRAMTMNPDATAAAFAEVLRLNRG